MRISSGGGTAQHCSFVFPEPLFYCPSLLYLLRAVALPPYDGCPHCFPRLVLCCAYCERVQKSTGAVIMQSSAGSLDRPGGLTPTHQGDGAVDGQCAVLGLSPADPLWIQWDLFRKRFQTVFPLNLFRGFFCQMMKISATCSAFSWCWQFHCLFQALAW